MKDEVWRRQRRRWMTEMEDGEEMETKDAAIRWTIKGGTYPEGEMTEDGGGGITTPELETRPPTWAWLELMERCR